MLWSLRNYNTLLMGDGIITGHHMSAPTPPWSPGHLTRYNFSLNISVQFPWVLCSRVRQERPPSGSRVSASSKYTAKGSQVASFQPIRTLQMVHWPISCQVGKVCSLGPDARIREAQARLWCPGLRSDREGG